uniref:Golgi SNAP receptor complex member 2 n=1 Tax=Trieres chinensis TaxID=1514140 RepID=A0A7S2AAF6_TRICV|mmetsp:Transcript_9519/g.20138  ORF Transcript_9519/g.20138 Transcript_9519/m.20138 type:complete len:210 (+) Transcript_9519:72-701(+)|eukprot:CAMPEP_0183297502 /NCGR_PEP_ID=MMETSP0160_2-20130417/4785_1 /TAXON_ID=2839 ORGANISM="Odontella Sinensis, Strain Grunow 1884" /NCGR_SAMPLE_ID=MMETSP0160_2 /ASSEMBLY_ACC=CAM_ASM_000250 /LENGTH=209 /DNA_ID=CAMNT_0025459339 /DNA_START=59 /DNA_END=688 /DNA_ORIENTATION=-
MTSVNELFPKARKLAYDARQQLSLVRNGSLSPHDLYMSLDELDRQLDSLDRLAAREPKASQRESWKRKVRELREDANLMRKRAERSAREMDAGERRRREREELLTRRRNRRGGGEEGDISNLTDENRSLEQSATMSRDLEMSAAASLDSLKDQRRRLGGIDRVMFAIGDRLNLTDVTMRIIERRDVTDAYLVAAGMVVTLIVIYLCYFL